MNVLDISILSRDFLIASGCADVVSLRELERLDRVAFDGLFESIRQWIEELS